MPKIRRERAEVSVIIPCYRCSGTIRRAVASAFKQSLIPEEIILVDDCSADGTLDYLYTIQNEYPNGWMKVLRLTKNCGPGSARNYGWENASQPFIAFLDADDSWHPQKIEVQYSWMKEHPDAVITGHGDVVLRNSYISAKFDTIRQPKSVPFSLFLISNRFPTRSVMLQRDISYRFVEGMRYSEDYSLWLRIVANGNKAYRFDMPLAFLYKAQFGEGGLSERLWELAKGEMSTYLQLKDDSLIGFFTYYFVLLISVVKFVRRYLLSMVRRVVMPLRRMLFGGNNV